MRANAKLDCGIVITVDLPSDAESISDWNPVSMVWPNGVGTTYMPTMATVVEGFNDEDHDAVITEIEAQIKWHKENP